MNKTLRRLYAFAAAVMLALYCAVAAAAAGKTGSLTVLLSDGDGAAVPDILIRLYRVGEPDGTLTPEERLLPQYEGQSTADVVIAALMDGPTEDGLQALIPEGVTGITARVEDGVCQLNLPSEELGAVDADTVEQMLRGIVTSLRSLEGISAVQVYRDGTYVDVYE